MVDKLKDQLILETTEMSKGFMFDLQVLQDLMYQCWVTMQMGKEVTSVAESHQIFASRISFDGSLKPF